ncbi:MAG: AbrB/MazE/SpoVT family DNA-binding domain-containing protein [Acidobacteria bacterium]|nr:AbrB/MazE/SpoVT family DNA-binding domain-containing protein [Acidobacteriota bacterium]MYH22382.1 AbrB/MazE/SpoVT family DNA-binding domain-containing protein [Acidobacteriota bacterium]MYK80458.1 AbrB/MazE/SpoVT family DNA-binding domain-containing protein [Acidobacteriota bacterium]
MCESLIDARGRTTIPKAVREALDLRGGDRIRYTVEDREARIRPQRSVAGLRGIVRHDGSPVSLEDMDQSVATGALRRCLR